MMNDKRLLLTSALVVSLVLLVTAGIGLAQGQPQGASPEADVGTAFTYQGELMDEGSPANGTYDFEFTLHDDATAASSVAGPVTVDDKMVTEGVFVAQLDFGAVFDGTALWLEIGVRPGGSTGAYTTLSPRQPLSPVPYAQSLRPGALVEGHVPYDPALTISNTGSAIDIYSENSNGIWVDWAGLNAFSVNAVDGSGLSVNIAGDHGVDIGTAYEDGLHIDRADAEGLEVVSATTGISVTAAETGMFVRGAGTDGLVVGAAGSNGVSVNLVGEDGVWVNLAGDDGMHVRWAGAPRLWNDSTLKNGFVVEGAEGHGLWIGHANNNGIVIDGADRHGILVRNADRDNTGDGVAGRFEGDVEITGNLSKGSGSFKIDHPLDPEHKTLSHSFVESPDMMNVYNGNATTGDEGYATVTLPDYFEALNTDYRYQLTAIGTFAQAIVAEEIEGNQFVIQTDQPNVKVSWQVTGVRQDPYARANPIEVEQEKPADEQGTYLHPDAYEEAGR